jgi:NMD protein affecting ribosome stability and mRNA decay
MAALMVRCVVCGVETAAANYGVSLATEMGVCPRCRAAYTPPRLDWENLYDGDH